jgi:RNA-directed DNA polymerase
LIVEERIKQGKAAKVMDTSKQGAEAHTLTPEMIAKMALRGRWKWVEVSIWNDTMLKALENGVKGGKWFSLIDKVYREHTLWVAWCKVSANKGAAGVDQITIERFEEQVDKYLSELEKELKDGTYQPKAVRRVYIPKGQGKSRPLGIPSVKDRIAQQAVKMAIEPIFEKEFLDSNYGFRPNKGAQEALELVRLLLEEGYTWVVDADLQSYFDNIPHKRLLDKVELRISDSRIIQLLDQWLKQEIMEECKGWKPTQGTPQGGVISPLLANIYLHDLDVAMTRAGYKMLRFADDFVILTKTKEEAEEALKLVRIWVAENELTLHPEKTHIGNAMIPGEGFEFLGYRFEAGSSWVRPKSIQKFRDRIRQETKRSCGRSIEFVIGKLNPILRGWCNYFKNVTKYTLGTFDSFVRRRLRAIIGQQNKKRTFGAGWLNVKIPNSFFASKGLFNMEAYQAAYLASQSR